MKPRTLLVLLVLVAGLGGFIWFFERERPGSEERERLARRVLDVEREQVARVELHAGERTVELVRTRKEGEEGAEQDQWRLAKPMDFPADYWQADGLVRTLAELERERELDEFEPAEVGLEQPRGRVVIELEGGERRELRIGAEVPGSGNLIVSVEGEDTASVVTGTLWESLEKDAGAWRDQDLFPAERDEVRAITLERLAALGPEGSSAGAPAAAPLTTSGEKDGAGAGSDGALVRLEREGGSRGDFLLAEPIRDRADEDAVNALLRELTGLSASEFLDAPPPLAELGLDPPRARITVALDQGEPFVVLWGAQKEGVEENYVKVGDLVVATAAALAEPLSRSPAEWRSPAWSSLPIYDVVEVTIAGADSALTLTRDEGSWRHGDLLLEQGPVTDFLYEIDDASAERVVDTGAVSLGTPELTITMTTRADEAPSQPTAEEDDSAAQTAAVADASPDQERLELFTPTPENLMPARVTGRDAILLLSRETRDQILAKLGAVRDAVAAGEELEESSPPATSTEE